MAFVHHNYEPQPQHLQQQQQQQPHSLPSYYTAHLMPQRRQSPLPHHQQVTAQTSLPLSTSPLPTVLGPRNHHHYNGQQQQHHQRRNPSPSALVGQPFLQPQQMPFNHHHNYQREAFRSIDDNSRHLPSSKYVVSRNGPLGTPGQANAAATFFAKEHQRMQSQLLPAPTFSNNHLVTNNNGNNHPSKSRRRKGDDSSSEEREIFPTNFRALVRRSPPPPPNAMLKRLADPNIATSDNASGMGRIRVLLRVSKAINCFDPQQQQEYSRHFQADQKKRQVTLYDPSVFRGSGNINGEASLDQEEARKIGVAAPKMFAFDGLFSCEDSQEEVCATALPDLIHSVVGAGNDACLFCFGHANLGKTRTMLGSDECSKDMGAIPIAIAWLYRAIKERKNKSGARFSVRVSALEITGQREEVRDLLAAHDTSETDQSPGVYLRSLPAVSNSCLLNQSEPRASSAEKAAFYLDAALSGRSMDAAGKESHLVFTLHVYQYSSNQTGRGGASVLGGRSRLHLIDFGGCERTRTAGGGITLSGLGNVILGIFNGQKHLPHRDSKVTQVLRDCLGSLTCQATMLAHVSPEASHYSETLHTVQLASRLHRMRRKRMKGGPRYDENGRRIRRSRSTGSGRSSSSDFTTTSGTSTNASSSEQSCDTVVYRGYSDESGTDCENPPPLLVPSFRTTMGFSSGSSNNGGGSAPGSLHGSFDDLPRPRRKILTNGAISPRRNLSPQPISSHHHHQFRSPNRSLSSLPVIHEVNTNSRKMPLNGLVPVPNRQRQQMHQVVRADTGSRSSNDKWSDSSNHKSSFFSERKEIWIDGEPDAILKRQQQQAVQAQQQQLQQKQAQAMAVNSKKQYGYMDEHKVNMISSWVEDQTEQHLQQQVQEQSVEPAQPEETVGFRALTQFKTCDSDETNSHDANAVVTASDNVITTTAIVEDNSQQQQQQQQQQPRQTPPPPPPRRTPPRDCSEQERKLRELVEECDMLAKTFTLSRMGLNEESKETEETGKEESNDFVEHPLRILSEENLTVVSSFGGSTNNLNENQEDHEEVDPSKLSFFRVPDFKEEDQSGLIARRFKEFEQLEKKGVKTPEGNNETTTDAVESKEVLLTFPRLPAANNFSNKMDVKQQSTAGFTTKNNDVIASDIMPTSVGVSPPASSMLTPHNQFLLLAQSLRHPDGASNPELNVTTTTSNASIAVQNRPNLQQRSPGNGKSSSDLEEEEVTVQQKMSSGQMNGATPAGAEVQQEGNESQLRGKKPKRKQSNREQQPGDINNLQKSSAGSRFALRFLRIFGSSRKLNRSSGDASSREEGTRRSKSCDRKVDEQAASSSSMLGVTQGNKVFPSHPSREGLLRGSMRAASSSPSIKVCERNSNDNWKKGKKKLKEKEGETEAAEELSTLSLSNSTEWEYQENEDEENGNGSKAREEEAHVGPVQRPHMLLMQRPMNNFGRNDRKSSGYDSLGGEESSSVDSNEDNNNALMREKLRRCQEGDSEVEQNRNSTKSKEIPYSIPTDLMNTEMAADSTYGRGGRDLPIVQYDELDILRMEQRVRNGTRRN